MQIGATDGARPTGTARGGSTPPPPALTPTQHGDLAAGRIRVAEGMTFAGTSPDAPATRDWGAQPAGSAYRAAFDSAAARIGTTDVTAVGAELDRQLYAAAPAPTPSPSPGPAPTPSASTPPAAAGSREGLGSAIEGAVMGNFSDNQSWSAIGGQVVTGFIPVVGQIADVRDTAASIGQIWRGEDGGWLNLGASVVGWVPGVGDAAKAAIRGGSHAVEAGADVATGVARHADEAADAAGGATAKVDVPSSANGVPGTTIIDTSVRTGLSEAKIREILDTAKPDRPDPSTYLSTKVIDAHLAPFAESGAIKFTPKSTIDKYDTLGPPDGGFVLPRSQFEKLIADTGGDLRQVEAALKLRAGELTSGDTVIAYIKPEDLQGLRMPSGNERGAWEGEWVPGGFTGGGVPEAVIDLPAGTPYTPVTLGD